MFVFDRILTEFGPELLWLPGDLRSYPKTAEVLDRPLYEVRIADTTLIDVRMRLAVSYEHNTTDLTVTITDNVTRTVVTDASPLVSYGSVATGEYGGISNVTHNGTTLVVTTSAAHGLSVGDEIIIYGVHGQLAANGTFLTHTGTTGSTIVLRTTADVDIASDGSFVTSPQAQWHKAIAGATELAPAHAGNGVYRYTRAGTLPLKHQTTYLRYCYDSGDYAYDYTRIVRETVSRR